MTYVMALPMHAAEIPPTATHIRDVVLAEGGRQGRHHLEPTAAVAAPFREALGCYTHGLLGAFAAMCRLTAQAMFRDLGEAGRLRLFDQLDEVRELSGVDDRSFEIARRIIFDSGTTSLPPAPGRADAAVLLEAMKDLLYQNYVRGGRLRKALRMRRFFAGEQELETSDSSDQVD